MGKSVFALSRLHNLSTHIASSAHQVSVISSTASNPEKNYIINTLIILMLIPSSSVD